MAIKGASGATLLRWVVLVAVLGPSSVDFFRFFLRFFVHGGAGGGVGAVRAANSAGRGLFALVLVAPIAVVVMGPP